MEVAGLDPRDYAELEEIGGGNAGLGAEQVIRGFLAGRRLRAMVEAAKE